MLLCSCSDYLREGMKTVTADTGTLLISDDHGILSDYDLRTICDSVPPAALEHRVRVESISYCTDYLGSRISARALLLIPLDVENVHLAEYLHSYISPGLTGAPSPVPSDFTPADVAAAPDEVNIELRRCAIPLAASGFFVVVPDYVGYGEHVKQGIEHPYLYYPEMFKANRDALYAARQYIEDKLSLDPGKDVFLCGWSEGGGACLSAHRYLEEKHSDDFNVVASSCLAGPYDMENLMLDLFSHSDSRNRHISRYVRAAYSINRFCPELRRPADQVFMVPVYDQSSSNLYVGAEPEKVFRPYFIKGVCDGTDKVFCSVIKDLSCCSWAPSDGTHIYLHHGTSDEDVPYFNSVNAADELKAAGTGSVELLTYQAQDHDSFLCKFTQNTIREFNALMK